MRARWANLSSLMVVGVLVLTMAAGCGKRTGPIIDPGDTPEATPTPAPAATATPAPTPTTSPDVPGGGNTGTILPLTARVQSVQTTGLMFTRRVIAVVEVANPGDRTLNGTVTCTFGDGEDTDQVLTKNVTMMGRETKTFTFEEKSWWDKTAKVEIKTDQPVTTQTGAKNYGY